MKSVGAAKAEAQFLAMIDDIQASGEPVLVTKRGRPVVEIFPARKPRRKKSIVGSLEGIIEITGDPDDFVKPIIPPEDWDTD